MKRMVLLLALLLFLAACIAEPTLSDEKPSNPAGTLLSDSEPAGVAADTERSQTDVATAQPILCFERSVALDGEELLLRFLGAEDGSGYYDGLQILHSDGKTLLYQTSLQVYGWEKGIPADTIEGNQYNFDILELIDVDFDGHTDIQMFCNYDGIWNIAYLYLIRDPETGGFTGDRYGLEGLGHPNFDNEARMVCSMWRGSAISHWYYWHEYQEGALVTVQEIVRFGVTVDKDLLEQVQLLVPAYEPDRRLTYYIHRVLNEDTGVLSQTEEYFQVADDDSETPLANYDVHTPQGEALWGLFCDEIKRYIG